MKEPAFDATPEFEHFTDVMRSILTVPKKRLDELVRDAKENSPRKGDPRAPGQKPAKRRSSRKNK